MRSDEAAATLADIENVVAKVKQSRIYRTAALLIILWGFVDLARDLLIALKPGGSARAGSWSTSSGSPEPSPSCVIVHPPPAFCCAFFRPSPSSTPSAGSGLASSWTSGRERRRRSGRRCSCSANVWRACGSARPSRRPASVSPRSSSPDTSGRARLSTCGWRPSPASASSPAGCGCGGAEGWTPRTTSSTSRCVCASWRR
jgi:hypothetical protein